MTEQRNPIDKDKTSDKPHSLSYAHHVGSAVIKPIDRGRVKGVALEAMYEQTNRQLDQIREQVELLARQAHEIHERVNISERIYLAQLNFKPVPGHIYHLYRRESGEEVLSLIGPKEWGNTNPVEFIATAKLLADHTWEIITAAESLTQTETQPK